MLSLNFITGALALAGAAASNASPVERASCSNYKIITARGTGVPQGEPRGYAGMLNTVLNNVSSSSWYDVVYNADLFSLQAGIDNLNAYLKAGVQNCPAQNYALIGYSQGAEVMNRVLINVNSTSNPTIWNRVKAVVYVGNPSHHAYSSVNFDQDSAKTTNPYDGMGIYPGLSAPLTPYINAGKLRDICYSYDHVCAKDMTNPDQNDKNDYHQAYNNSNRVQRQGANFLLSKINA